MLMCDWEHYNKPDKFCGPFYLCTIDRLHHPNMVSYSEMMHGVEGVGGPTSVAGSPSQML